VAVQLPEMASGENIEVVHPMVGNVANTNLAVNEVSIVAAKKVLTEATATSVRVASLVTVTVVVMIVLIGRAVSSATATAAVTTDRVANTVTATIEEVVAAKGLGNRQELQVGRKTTVAVMIVRVANMVTVIGAAMIGRVVSMATGIVTVTTDRAENTATATIEEAAMTATTAGAMTGRIVLDGSVQEIQNGANRIVKRVSREFVEILNLNSLKICN